MASIAIRGEAMWKVLIADDEPKIRRGLRNAVEWQALDMEVVGEAEDGELALAAAREWQPDIVLVDICMPFVNGLQFIEQLKQICANAIVIVITGHDEFAYAQQAVKLRVFDYLLKPVASEQLLEVLAKARQEAERLHAQTHYVSWASREMRKSLPLLREKFGQDWIAGRLSPAEIAEQLTYLQIIWPADAGMLLLKAAGSFGSQQLLAEWDKDLLLFALENLAGDILAGEREQLIFRDSHDHILVITPVGVVQEWYERTLYLQQQLTERLRQVILISQRPLSGSLAAVPAVYQQLSRELKQQNSYTPVVLLAQQYIHTHYAQEELSLQEVAAVVQMSPSYLSRLIKQEIGVSFVDYLTRVRVQTAIQLMHDPAAKLYEVAAQVGYANQHYFSTAFKKVLGMAPAEYRKRGMRC